MHESPCTPLYSAPWYEHTDLDDIENGHMNVAAAYIGGCVPSWEKTDVANFMEDEYGWVCEQVLWDSVTRNCPCANLMSPYARRNVIPVACQQCWLRVCSKCFNEQVLAPRWYV